MAIAGTQLQALTQGMAHPELPGGGAAPAKARAVVGAQRHPLQQRSEEHTSELQSLMRISYAVFCLKKKNIKDITKLCIRQQLNNHYSSHIRIVHHHLLS